MRTSIHVRRRWSARIAVTLAIGMLAAAQTVSAAGPAPVGLGTAGTFAVLAGEGITNTGATTIVGDVGSYATPSMTGFGTVVLTGTNHGGDAVTQVAKADLTAAYGVAAGATPVTVVTGGTLGGLTLVGGVYSASGNTLGLTGTLTLDGQDDPSSVWIFQATSDLITASSSVVRFVNGADPCNVFWQVTSSATLGSGSTFAGTIMALTSITMGSSVTLNGRALARNGTVTMINDTINRPPCSGSTAPSTPAPTTTPTPPNAAFSGSNPTAQLGPVLFALAVIGSLGTLTLATMRTVRRRR